MAEFLGKAFLSFLLVLGAVEAVGSSCSHCCGREKRGGLLSAHI